MARKTLPLSAIALLITSAAAEHSQISITGIVTEAQSYDGAFEGMRAGDTWTFNMFFERVPVSPWSGDFGSLIDFSNLFDDTPGFNLISATFSTRVGSMSISEFDLANFNSQYINLFLDGPPTDAEREAAEAQRLANTRFDMLLFDYDPLTAPSFDTGNIDLSFDNEFLRLVSSPDPANLSYMESILPQNIFGPTAAGERWSTMNLNGARITSQITDYFITDVGGRSVPSPSGLVLLGVFGLAGARRRR